MRRFSLSLLLAGLAVGRLLGSDPTNAPSGPATPQPLGPAEQAKALARAQLAEKLRAECIEARRYVAGRVIEITAKGLIVESGYSALLQPPFNQSWVVRGNATVAKDLDTPEEKHPDAVCRGLVLLTSIPPSSQGETVRLRRHPRLSGGRGVVPTGSWGGENDSPLLGQPRDGGSIGGGAA